MSELITKLERIGERTLLGGAVVLVLIGVCWVLVGDSARGIQDFAVAVIAFAVWKILRLAEDGTQR